MCGKTPFGSQHPEMLRLFMGAHPAAGAPSTCTQVWNWAQGSRGEAPMVAPQSNGTKAIRLDGKTGARKLPHFRDKTIKTTKRNGQTERR